MRRRAPAPTVGRRIRVHDRHQFELKLEVQPSETARRSRYVVEVFLCIPHSLNVSAETVAREGIYRDIHNYVRLKTPLMSWPELEALPSSPLARLADALEAPVADPQVIVHECKLLACVFRARLRDLAVEAEGELAGTVDRRAFERLGESCATTLDAAAQLAGRYRALAERAERADLPERARAAYRLADEYMSVSMEHMVRRVIVSVTRAALAAEQAGAAAALRRSLLDTILREEAYRQKRGFPTIIDPRTDNERYIYRTGLLKKYCSSALFLPLHRDFTRKRWQDLVYALAAGIAMTFFMAVAFWGQERYKGLAGLFVVPIVAYMFREHIKEGTRSLFSRLLERHLYDRKIVIDDPAGGELGWLREKIGYVPSEGLPADIVEVRRRSVDPTLRAAEEELHETVIHYRKEIILAARRLVARRGATGLTDIVRFHVGRWTRDMDEPAGEIDYVDASTQSLGPVQAAKTYRVDVAFRFHARVGRPPSTQLMRLILDRNGIKRIERVEGRASGPVSSVRGQGA